MVVIQIETLHTLSVLISACIHVCELKKPYFASTYFYEWQVFESFEFINFSPKEKRIRDIWLMFLSRLMEKQAGQVGKTVVI